jgi:hypothetical protein
MIHVPGLQSAMIFGYIFGIVWHDPKTSNECSVLHGALHPDLPLVYSAAPSQAKGASPGKIRGLVEIPKLELRNQKRV